MKKTKLIMLLRRDYVFSAFSVQSNVPYVYQSTTLIVQDLYHFQVCAIMSLSWHALIYVLSVIIVIVMSVPL